MDKKIIAAIIILIAVIVVIAGMILVNFNKKNIEYETLNLSDTCSLSVPVCNNSTFKENDGFKTYNGTNITILFYNKNDFGAWENLGADIGIQGGLNQNFKYNHTHQGKNILIHPEENKTIFGCLITNNTTGDVVFVVSQNEEILYHAIDSINFTAGNNTNITKNTTDVKTSGSAVKTNSTSSKSTNEKKIDEGAYAEGYIAENDQDFDYDGDGVGDGSAYHSHEYYVERGQTEPIRLGGG